MELDKKVIGLLASLLLYLQHLVKHACVANGTEPTTKIETCRSKLHSFMNHWLENTKVIGTAFGGTWFRTFRSLKRIAQELEVLFVVLSNIVTVFIFFHSHF